MELKSKQQQSLNSCFTCLRQSKEVMQIFSEASDPSSVTIVELLTKHFWFQQAEFINQKHFICWSCWKRLDKFHRFYQEVEQNHRTLNQELPKVSACNVEAKLMDDEDFYYVVEMQHDEAELKEESWVESEEKWFNEESEPESSSDVENSERGVRDPGEPPLPKRPNPLSISSSMSRCSDGNSSPNSRLIHICDSHRRKSFAKCYPSIFYLLQKGRSHFQNQSLTRVVLEVDGSMIFDDEVLDELSSKGLSFMLLENSEEWSLAKNNHTVGINNNDQRNKQKTQISQEPHKCQPLNASDSTLSSIAQIKKAKCVIVHASVSNASTIANPLALPSTRTSRLVKRKTSLNDVGEQPRKRTANPSTCERSSIPIRNPSIASSCATVEETDCYIVYANESQIFLQEDPLVVSATSGVMEENLSSPEGEAPTNTASLLDPLSPKNDHPTSVTLDNFEINWKIIPNDVINQLEGHQPNAGYRGISDTNYNRFVDHITAQMRTICTRIPIRIIRKIALQITTKYSVLRDCDGDAIIIGDGSTSLADKLRYHNNYLNTRTRNYRRSNNS